MKQALKNEMVKLYEKTLDKNSQWYLHDLKTFKNRVSTLSVKELKEGVERLNQYANPNSHFNKSVKKEVSKLAKGGMYDVNKLAPKNMLD